MWLFIARGLAITTFLTVAVGLGVLVGKFTVIAHTQMEQYNGKR